MDSGMTEAFRQAADVEAETPITAGNPAALTGQHAAALVARLRKELREVRDQANRYVVEAATLRMKLREAEAQATAGVTLARYCETIGWNTGDARARAWLDGLSERIDAVTGRVIGPGEER
jgi:hypothetical protein